KYTGNRLNQIIESSLNDTGYEGGNNTIDYDLNGNMVNMKDKGIQNIVYNYLNLPKSFLITQPDLLGNGQTSNSNLDYLYRADGVKLRKTYSSAPPRGLTNITMTDYLDGFQYTYREGDGICLACRTETAFEEQAYKNINTLSGIVITPEWRLDFVPTAEGFYSFTENRYIYQYRDHLGNARVSFAKNSEGALEITDTNNYYPFGLNHIEGMLSTSNFGGYYSYKYNGKELQETGMYDYGARFYMPDLGRWGVVDPRSQYTHEAYSYVWNNPISFWDPTGMQGELAYPDRDGRKDGEFWKDSDGEFYWDAKNSVWKDFNSGESLISQVNLLGKSKDNNSGYAAATTLGAMTSESGVGLIILGVVGLAYIVDQATKPPLQWHTTIADPGIGYGSMNTEDTAEEETDVNGVKVPQEGKPDARYEPKDLQEQLTIEEAESGEGDTIMSGKLNDPKYNHNTKMKHTHDHGDGTKTEVHYDINNQTGKRSGFKIKDGTNAKSRGHRYP
ncbi:RHS repeat-associated core domain-containing protein, partial [Chryseobacterium culicis]